MGVEVLLDVWELRLGQDTTEFMQRAISDSDRVLMVCTEKYVARANDGKGGGVPFEGMIIRDELVENIDTVKFIPVIRDQPEAIRIPKFMGHRMYVDFREDGAYVATTLELARDIYGLSSKPLLGKSPFENG